jgi:hypothetical protein
MGKFEPKTRFLTATTREVRRARRSTQSPAGRPTCAAAPVRAARKGYHWRTNWRTDAQERLIMRRQEPGFWLHNRKRPTGEAGRFWGYYREERALDG